MHVILNDRQVVKMTLTLVLTGVWNAQLEVDATQSIEGAVTISIADALTFAGTAQTGRSGIYGGRLNIRVNGGAGRLGEQIPGKHYANVQARLPLREILQAVGETIAPDSDSTVLATQLRHWVRARNPAQRELALLVSHLGSNWRVTTQGRVWVGQDTWTEAALDEWAEIEDNRADGRVLIGANVPDVYPGQTFDGRRVQTVVHSLDRATLRTEVTFLDD